MISKRVLLAFYVSAFSFSLFGEASLQYYYGVHYPDGIIGSVKIDSDDFSSYLSLNYFDYQIAVDGFCFKSDPLQLGPIAFEGILSELNGDRQTFFSTEEMNRLIINREGNPRSNLGVVFTPPQTGMGLSFFRRDDFSGGLFWYEPDFLSFGSLVLAQSLTTVEGQSSDDTWYLDEPELYSSLLFHSLFSLVLGNEDLYGGGRIILNRALRDSGGFSLLLRAGGSLSSARFQSEFSWTSPYYFSADLDHSDYPLIWKNRIVLDEHPIVLDCRFFIQSEKTGLPWEYRGIVLENEISLLLKNHAWDLEGEFLWELAQAGFGQWEPRIKTNVKYKRRVSFWFWDACVMGEYDAGIFNYVFSLSGGVIRNPVESDVSIVVEIDKRILLDAGAMFKYDADPIILSAEILLEDIGLYNFSEIIFKPSFALTMTINHKIAPGFDQASDL